MEQPIESALGTLVQKPFHRAVLATFEPGKAMRSAHVHSKLLADAKRSLSAFTVRKALSDLAAAGCIVRLFQGVYALPGYVDPAITLGDWVLRVMRQDPGQLFTSNTLARRYRADEGRRLPAELFAIELRRLNRHTVERGTGHYQLSPDDVFAL